MSGLCSPDKAIRCDTFSSVPRTPTPSATSVTWKTASGRAGTVMVGYDIVDEDRLEAAVAKRFGNPNGTILAEPGVPQAPASR